MFVGVVDFPKRTNIENSDTGLILLGNTVNNKVRPTTHSRLMINRNFIERARSAT